MRIIDIVNLLILLAFLWVIYDSVSEYKKTKKWKHLLIVVVFVLATLEKIYYLITK